MVALARYYKIGEDRKAMRPLIPEPEGNQQAQKYTLAFGGTQTMANIFGEGKPRGEIEAVLRYLADLAPEQYDLVADDGELQTEGAA